MLFNKLKTFAAGLHIKDYKWLAKNQPITKMPLPAKVKIPVSQHFGKPAQPIVKPGDLVKTGQLIAQAQGNFSANIHASLSGKVTAISRFPHPLGPESLMIDIESDGKDEAAAPLTGTDPLALIAEAGIVGMGGAMFPTHIKLKPPPGKKVETIILNGVECEPYVTSDYRLMLEEADQVLAGLRIIMQATGVERAYIGIEANKQDIISLIREKLKSANGIEVVGLKTKYPQGGEKQLIQAVLNREVPSAGLPFDVGVIVQNVATTAAIADAVNKKRPLFERVVTVTGSCVEKPANLLVRLGTSFKELVDFCGLKCAPGKVVMGGPMMGLAQYTLAVPVIKGTNAILVMNEKEARPRNVDVCLRCGRCLWNCPMGLESGIIATLVEKGLFEEAIAKGAKDCIECGLCAYNCPAARDVVQLIKYAKQKK